MNYLRICTCAFVCCFFLWTCSGKPNYPVLDHAQLAAGYFKEDAAWFADKIPFFECSDKDMEKVYYYRWKLYKAHIREVGENNYVITEFINHVPWDRDPFCTINAASMHHIYEGRWLKDDRYMNGYINYLFQQGGNNRRYSESVSDAAYARYLVNADSNFLISQLDSMKEIYKGWNDHYDSARQLYYIPAMPDATEYTIASIDASGGKDGFDDGEAFRPTINSYMYANALAISRIAAMKGESSTANEYAGRARALRKNVMDQLWSDSFQHFLDRFKVNNEYVHNWDFIRGRELAGLIPWYFNLPEDSPVYSAAWKHAIDTSALLGAYGLRTNEPSYEYYFKQFVFFQGQRGSQWNGPSWPYQSSQALTGMANLLNDYHQTEITRNDYIKLLRLFTRQHILPDSTINLVENYDPNLGGPIVYYYWSNHYNHSSFNNLIISGLCGIRPSAGDTLEINPLTDDSIDYFCLDDLQYHGHRLSIVYDKDGKKYGFGKGLTVFVDGKLFRPSGVNGKSRVYVGSPKQVPPKRDPLNLALNIDYKGYPAPAASANTIPDSLFQAIDGRIWYFPEISNRWSTLGSGSDSDWYVVDFGDLKNISVIKISLYDDGKTFAIPEHIKIEYNDGNGWRLIHATRQVPEKFMGNTTNILSITPVKAKAVRLTFTHPKFQVGLTELQCY